MTKKLRALYIRVSTEQGNIARQEVLKKEYDVDEVFVDRSSGKSTSNRPALELMMSRLDEFECVIVDSISRFARNTKDLLELLEKLNVKGVKFISKKESIDTSTPTGAFMVTVFGAVATLEREYIVQRVREGVKIAVAAGKYKGRKRVEVNDKQFARVYAQWKNGDIKGTEAQRLLNLKPRTFYRRVTEYESRGE